MDNIHKILGLLGDFILQIIQSPEVWAVWMLIASIGMIMAFKDYIAIVAKWTFIVLLGFLFLYGVGVLSEGRIEYVDKIIEPIISKKVEKEKPVGFWKRIRGYGDEKAIAPVRWFRNSILRKDDDIEVVNHGWKNKEKS